MSLVVGGAHGIGRSIVELLAGAGAAIAVADIDGPAALAAAAEIRAAGGRSTAITADVRRESDVRAMTAAVINDWGRIDHLVYCPATAAPARVRDLSLDAWTEAIAVNLTGAFLAARAVVPFMADRRFGRIILIGSQLAARGAPEVAHYCASKGGIESFARALAREVASDGITVNVVAPGPITGPRLDAAPESVLAQLLAELPLGRFGRPDEVSPTVLLLAGDGGAFYTGATLHVCGGHVMP